MRDYSYAQPLHHLQAPLIVQLLLVVLLRAKGG
jgi:hypothetical protein